MVSQPQDIPILVVRHAKASIQGICYGQSEIDVELSPATAAQRVLACRPELALYLDVLWTSPLERAYLLAQCLGKLCHQNLRVDPRLAELKFGDWEGRSWEDIYRTDGERLARWAADPMGVAPPNGESGNDLVARVSEWSAAIGRARVLAVTHAGPIRVLRAMAATGNDLSGLTLDLAKAVPHLQVEEISAKVRCSK